MSITETRQRGHGESMPRRTTGEVSDQLATGGFQANAKAFHARRSVRAALSRQSFLSQAGTTGVVR
jgi:hypothetical protein